MVEWVITMSIQTRSTWDESQDVIIVAYEEKMSQLLKLMIF